ncbi:MAG: hypothetical protein A3C06_00715 [Candidatus Taylorbacteria bacterium RIFCSPHIGHO2_02_FULL_46_13]|uniref:Uncharacterized protein n=2 Tax=Parcubacteria group TaxID=1794811 RepID=A0A1G2HUP3_9BACT|nr:MAG: hypothetical protein A2822_03585 [Candidatus Staskawiczbacteria bacterium RIFCSPHIGHO2_01_FULL_41_41]OGZ75028.1 MAG: hypothetical protein A3A12_04365 [Candidatus Staskawiczbacteria bacterium RIFCSPLOWO2_01_FULL_43_17b]OHA26061.1 MAG: hypothetical protein A3C06_00715 [Candidatus Taylorbacteria bacterium RIFCSPHIGHO2_02_FULL_46_13]
MEDATVKLKNNKGSFYAPPNLENKKNVLIITAVVIILALALLVGGYVFYKSTKNAGSPVDDSNQEAAQEATKGVLPSVSNNPLESRPNLNPVDNTNPITEVKTNPFE